MDDAWELMCDEAKKRALDLLLGEPHQHTTREGDFMTLQSKAGKSVRVHWREFEAALNIVMPAVQREFEAGGRTD